MMKFNWRNVILGSVLCVAGFVTGQYQLIVNGVTLAGNSMVVTPSPATVVVPADAKTINEVIKETQEK